MVGVEGRQKRSVRKVRRSFARITSGNRRDWIDAVITLPWGITDRLPTK